MNLILITELPDTSMRQQKSGEYPLSPFGKLFIPQSNNIGSDGSRHRHKCDEQIRGIASLIGSEGKRILNIGFPIYIQIKIK